MQQRTLGTNAHLEEVEGSDGHAQYGAGGGSEQDVGVFDGQRLKREANAVLQARHGHCHGAQATTLHVHQHESRLLQQLLWV